MKLREVLVEMRQVLGESGIDDSPPGEGPEQLGRVQWKSRGDVLALGTLGGMRDSKVKTALGDALRAVAASIGAKPRDMRITYANQGKQMMATLKLEPNVSVSKPEEQAKHTTAGEQVLTAAGFKLAPA